VRRKKIWNPTFGAPNERGLPNATMAALRAIIEHGGFASRYQIQAASRYELLSSDRVLFTIQKYGWVYRPYNGFWAITERGKLVLAIEIGRRTKDRCRRNEYAERPPKVVSIPVIQCKSPIRKSVCMRGRPANTERNETILSLRGKLSYSLIAKNLGISRGAVAAVCWRADWPKRYKSGTGRHGGGEFAILTVDNLREQKTRHGIAIVHP
jgi:hypothetical protein